jgi:hypothetical protein
MENLFVPKGGFLVRLPKKQRRAPFFTAADATPLTVPPEKSMLETQDTHGRVGPCA